MNQESNTQSQEYIYLKERFEKELDFEWRQEISEGIDDILDNYELLFGEQIVNTEKLVIPMYFDPISYSDEHKRLYELEDLERKFIINHFLTALQFNPDANRMHTSYEVDAPESDNPDIPINWEGTAEVIVYELAEEFQERDMYLHQIRYPDKTIDSRQKVDYFVAPGDYTLS